MNESIFHNAIANANVHSQRSLQEYQKSTLWLNRLKKKKKKEALQRLTGSNRVNKNESVSWYLRELNSKTGKRGSKIRNNEKFPGFLFTGLVQFRDT